MTFAGIFQISQQIFVNIANKKPQGQQSDVIVFDFPLSDKRNYVVEEFSAKNQRAIISWDHYFTTLQIFHRMHSDYFQPEDDI